MLDNREVMDDVLKWLHKNYLKGVLETYESDVVDSIELNIKRATEKGEGFLGDLYRVTVKYFVRNGEPKNISLILKTQRDDPNIEEIASEYNIYERELQAYQHIIKDCMEILKEVGDDTIFAPRLVFCDERAIVLEDLSIREYKIKDCKKRLNLEECKMVLEKVAKYHASTAVLYERNPEKFRYHMQSNVSETFNILHQFYQNTMESCIVYAETVPQLQPYIERLKKYQKIVVEEMIDVFRRDEQSFNVLNHGDLWINNLMFHSTESEADDVLLIDYQEGFLGSPGIDLNWFTYTSCNQEVLDRHLQTLYQYYYDILAETLRKLHYSKAIPTFDEIQSEIKKKAFHGLTTLICFTPIFFNDRKEYADASNFISDSEECQLIRKEVFNNPMYGQFLLANLPRFVESGHL